MYEYIYRSKLISRLVNKVPVYVSYNSYRQYTIKLLLRECKDLFGHTSTTIIIKIYIAYGNLHLLSIKT